MILYRDLIQEAMAMLGLNERTCVVGYNVSPVGGFASGSFKDFPENRIHEMPLAEASMTGAAIGMSLDGWVPILFFERMDFILLALDQIVNTMDKLAHLSQGIHKPGVIVRVVVGNKATPLYTGPTHCQDFSVALRQIVEMPVINLMWHSGILSAYDKALGDALNGKSTVLVEYKDIYGTTA